LAVNALASEAMPAAVLRLTPAAADRVRGILARAEQPAAGLRIGIKKGGCAGMEYTMEVAAERGRFDEVVEADGATVLVDPKAVLYLLGTEMDWQADKLASRFVFNNPNQTGACGCGESVQLVPAKAEPAPA
jgi:iron-sulfur cluster assembly protein